ncbi:MAG TPA: beta-eliminating lyase-related protein, partial [Armatimonadota bacterium]|nr:beta-eliminating lyase-related protein [Armatimonadota bacterium]
RQLRKTIGGGMRQAGVIAAPARVALEKGPGRLHEDHENARLIAETLEGLRGLDIDLPTVQTNIINFAVRRDDMTAPQLCERLGDYGILAGAKDRANIRFVTHVQVTREDTEAICAALTELLGS